ncbi:polysaccharide deacetylase family protein [Pandoraea commovens]|uniref:Polysaccharide deacetylase family protein n=1 Tax=Pandoraea commovens TaxID=2508289 RepID=A0ABY5QNG7_9BURK|nr:polysaccharide deacetylase family protein [Pandoraea commovens]UVA81952.1 polysaccharide deacetylase family protein [Pandoraea commovens]
MSVDAASGQTVAAFVRLSARWLALSLSAVALLLGVPTGASAEQMQHDVLILVYHRFTDGELVREPDSTTVSMRMFRTQLKFFTDNGYRIVPMADVLAWLTGSQDTLPPRALVLTMDDGHRSIFEIAWPMLKAASVPVTLFLYPSAISNAAYAMTWAQVRELALSTQVDVGSHTYWHPNFKTERARRPPADYERFVHDQLRRSRVSLEAATGKPVQWLAWPFGIYDTQLESIARDEGYRYAFSIDAKPVTRNTDSMAIPRYLMTQDCAAACLRRMLAQAQTLHD